MTFDLELIDGKLTIHHDRLKKIEALGYSQYQIQTALITAGKYYEKQEHVITDLGMICSLCGSMNVTFSGTCGVCRDCGASLGCS